LHLRGKAFNILSVVEAKELPIDFRHLRTFCRVADLKSFSKAADDLFVTQPTVSGHILSLEKSFSLRLFDRAGREVHLTKAGEVLLQHASKILSSRKDLLNALSEFSQGIRGELSLGASTIPGEYLLPKLVGGFKEEHPNFVISLKISDTKEIVQAVQEGKVEFGLIGARLKFDSLRYELFGEDKIIIIGPQKEKIGVEEMFRKPWIIREEGSGTQMAVEKVLKRMGRTLKQLNVVLEMGSTSAVKEAVKAKLGYAFISVGAVEEELSQGRLCRVEVKEMEPISRQIYVVFRKGKTFSPMGAEFLGYLKKRRIAGAP
jgi:DNA-binding transcriptional LysR family regulator